MNCSFEPCQAPLRHCNGRISVPSGALYILFFAAVGITLSGCASPSEPNSAAEQFCSERELQGARSLLLEASGMSLPRPPSPKLESGPRVAGPGFTAQALRWIHSDGESEVHAHLLLPSPLPAGELPLLLNTHGHWGAGIYSREVAARGQLFAREGWAVLSVASRGSEGGALQPPPWLQAHFSEGLYGELRGRRSGRPPLRWELKALWGGLDAALAGRLEVPIQREAVAVMGFSGGAERAILLAASDPRIDAAVIGAAEYAFTTQNGQALCSCGALPGAQQHQQHWLAQIACRPGNPPSARPALLWQDPSLNQTPLPISDRAPLTIRPAASHGVSDAQAVESLFFLEQALLGRSSDPQRHGRLLDQLQRDYFQLDQRLLMTARRTRAPGHIEQGPPPWRDAGPIRASAARAAMGLIEGAPPLKRPPGLGPARMKLQPASPGGDGSGWIVVVADEPLLDGVSWKDRPPETSSIPDSQALPADVPMVFVQPAVAQGADADLQASRWGIDGLGTALGLAVEDVLEAHRRLRGLPGVNPAKIGFIGVGPAGLAALWAAALVGEGGPIALIDAPVTLWWEGPLTGEWPQPWPAWLLAPSVGGAALDPYLVARSLKHRVRWLRPRNGDGKAWQRQRIPGLQVEQAADLFVEPTSP